MRRGNKPEAEDYIKVRLEFLHEEKKKNDKLLAYMRYAKVVNEEDLL